MRSSDTDIFILPGYTNSEGNHWQTRWERQLSTAKRVEQDDWHKPILNEWTSRIVRDVSKASRPAILIAHSLGVLAAVHAAESLPKGLVRGAFLVAPPDLNRPDAPSAIDKDFALSLDHALPFPSVLIASRDDPFCSFEYAEQLGEHWKSEFVDAGYAGHINTASGYGPWPEGLMRLASFLKRLS